MADHLTDALLHIAKDALHRNQAFNKEVRSMGGTKQYEPDETEAARKSLGAFVVAHDWQRKLLDRTPGNWMAHETLDFIGVSLSSAFAIFATECLHHESLTGDPRFQELLDKSVASLFRGFVVIYPEARVRQIWDAAFAFKKSLRSSSEPKAVEMRENLANLALMDTLNRITRKIPEGKIEMLLFGLFGAFRGGIEHRTA